MSIISILDRGRCATEESFSLNHTVLEDNDNVSIKLSFLDLQRTSNWLSYLSLTIRLRGKERGFYYSHFKKTKLSKSKEAYSEVYGG